MGLFYNYLKREASELAKEGVALRVIGRRDRFSSRLKKAIDQAESIACDGDATLIIAADYGGCWDIAHAAQQAVAQADGQPIDESAIAKHIQTADLPPLDLLIRTGGELRISNFLLWQAAYAELYFCDTLWPDFDKEALNQAVDEFHRRQRRFGRTSEQVAKDASHA